MARMRTLKPETFTSETLCQVVVKARWTFAGLWTYVDDKGRGKADPRLIKAALWPLDDDVDWQDVAQYLDDLERVGLICRYEHEGRKLVHVVNFPEHQKPNRPVPSKLPECCKGVHGGLPDPSRTTHGALTESSLSPQNDCVGDGSEPSFTRSEARSTPSGGNTGPIGGEAAKTAGQDGFTEDSVSPHGALTPTSFSNTPTPSPSGTRIGDGEGDVGKPSTSEIAARSPDPDDHADESEDQPDIVRPDVERICTHLADRIHANSGDRPRIGKKWRDAARLLLDKDGRTEEQVHACIDWCQDSEFWRSNILSMPKLREQYTRLRMQAQQPGRSSSPSPFAPGSGQRAMPDASDYGQGKARI